MKWISILEKIKSRNVLRLTTGDLGLLTNSIDQKTSYELLQTLIFTLYTKLGIHIYFYI